MLRGKIALFLLVTLVMLTAGAVFGVAMLKNTISELKAQADYPATATAPVAEATPDDPLTVALTDGNVAEAKRLIPSYDREARDWDDDLALAVALKDKALIRSIVEKGGNPDSALDYALTAEAAAELVRLGAKVNTDMGPKGDSHLETQALNGNAEVTEWYLKHGANANEVDSDGVSLISKVKDSLKTAVDADDKAGLSEVLAVLKRHGAKE